jgi:murein DD-endopeptidase MepM/ murein hydrolase activator NlpD
MNRRTLFAAAFTLPATGWNRSCQAQVTDPLFQYPIGWPGKVPADGFVIRHGYACENTWYNPGYLHTGEDWYAREGESAGAEIYATAAGTVVFAGSDYPGRVVVIQHEPGLFSMYGHLEYALEVGEGTAVEMGQRIGTVLFRTDGAAPSHLHFEIRTFLTTPEVNGNQPRYGFACGNNCVPGPGYWPIDAPEHPSAMGWRNPTHVIARRMLAERQSPNNVNAVVTESGETRARLWTLPSDRANAEEIGEHQFAQGDRFPVRSIATGPEVTDGISAEQYRLWYQIELPEGETPWVQAAAPSDIETGSDSRPSAIVLTLTPAVSTSAIRSR